VKISIAVLVTVAALVGVLPAASETGGRSSANAIPPASTFLPKRMFAPRQTVFFGYPKSLKRAGDHYVARIDPSLMLTGVTASTAAVEDGMLRQGEPVPNDYYERNESKRPLTYRVPANAHVTVIANPGNLRSVVVPVSEFTRIVQGKNPKKRQGLWSTASGFWIRVQGDTALAFDQAYRP
jgi:hypothetical protein